MLVWRELRVQMIQKTLAYLAVYIGWGTTYLAIKVGMTDLGPATFLALRFLLTAILLAPIIYWRHPIKSSNGSAAMNSAFIGVMLFVGGLFPVSISEASIPSGVVGLIIGCAPIGFAMAEWILNGKQISNNVLVGLVVGIVGIAVLSLGSATATSFTLNILSWHFASLIFGIIVWSFFSVYSKKLGTLSNPLADAFIQYISAGLILFAVAYFVEGFHLGKLFAASRATLISLVYIILIPTIFSYTAYLWLLKNEPSHRVATYAFANPIVALFAGFVILEEPLSPKIFVSLLLIAVATFFTFREKLVRSEAR